MRAVLQRVSAASVRVAGAEVGRIGAGAMILVCAMAQDAEAEAEALALRISKLRIFRDAAGKMNRSLLDVAGAALVVSQFTLAAELRGNRPGFSRAAPPAAGERLYRHFSTSLAALGVPVANGIFGADMAVSLTNDGPVTIWIDTAA